MTTPFFKPEDSDLLIDNKPTGYFSIEKANRILAKKGVRVYGSPNAPADPRDGIDSRAWSTGQPIDIDTHTAILIAIEPLEKDTAESLLKEWINYVEGGWDERRSGLLDRTRRLLEGK